MGYDVTTVAEGKDAVLAIECSLVESEPFVLALMDLTIPGGIGGKEAVAAIRGKCPALIAIATSGYSEDPIIAQPTRFGFDANLAKPFSPKELANVLANHVPGARSEPVVCRSLVFVGT
jgi:two-component system, cell cycle sensor histidine kinase and response regulator CckA